MAHTVQYITNDIKLSTQEDFFKSDIRFKEHLLVWFISGKSRIVQADREYEFNGGDVFLIPRNQLATSFNYPVGGSPHQTVSMHLSTKVLQQYYAKTIANNSRHEAAGIKLYENHPLLRSYLNSVIPYFEIKKLPDDLALLKMTEAISILRNIDAGVDSILSNFEEPGKIDIVEYMETNFIFNLPLEKFSYLTGRSLATFKRDFFKAFGITPQRWLTMKRLELAHFHLAEKGRNAVDIFYELGFEDLSHFSYAFKKRFGYAPSTLNKA